jgi:MFS family permease
VGQRAGLSGVVEKPSLLLSSVASVQDNYHRQKQVLNLPSAFFNNFPLFVYTESNERSVGKQTQAEIRRLKWIFGTTYAVQGSSALSDIPTLYFVKFVLEMGDAGGQLFQSLKSIGWLVKPLWGFISDRFPLFGYRRKSWFVLMALLGVVFWMLNAMLAFLGVQIPLAYLVGFNLAFSTYAFVDVVTDAIMVEHGRRLKRVGSFVNFQWTMLALANAIVTAFSGWFQERIQDGEFAYWVIFGATGLPPLITAVVGLINIPEQPVHLSKRARHHGRHFWWSNLPIRMRGTIRLLPATLRALSPENRLLMLLMLFIVLWNFSPSIGYIERSYLIDVRGFTPAVFGTVFTLQAFTFLVSIIAYRFVLRYWPSVRWYHYLYAMIFIMVLAFPLSFYFYLDPDHPWWHYVWIDIPREWNPIPQWNRYVWFRIFFSVLFGFATIPAFMIPLRVAGEVVKIQYAGMSYAFLMALSNVTNTFEGLVGSGLYWWFSRSWMSWLLETFYLSPLDIARVADKRTLILQLFIYISLFFTLLSVPVVVVLKRALTRHGIQISTIEPSS